METFAVALTVFVLAIFVGFEVITKVPPTLHTPLMSGSNAISGITLIGAILSAGAQHTMLSALLGTLAVIFATINVVGGFLVTHRMLQMFKPAQRTQHDRQVQ
ncbi:MAG: NAD(P) transhydrogenase subunit alpha [Armatimonadetes bacterium JP3_11]|jgi:NAD(P) transhydrogenase subunit alpha|nr:MAG: NAD(P) transhydrogenase subunit alpha [Armatimonadetes bacterium CP1_7O]OYT75167.1 MAG: NAD(P) transhydrogenase subunit alpha [Armatimonadetes bacterium JP3_11]RMH10031.1 MAG: NAD(P) transhydrogenase subunit alpha [Armatimonadota bacterium]